MEQSTEQGLVDPVQSPRHPQGFQQVMLIPGIFLIQAGNPCLELGKDVRRLTPPELTTGPVACPVFRKLEIIQQLLDTGTGHLGGFYEGT